MTDQDVHHGPMQSAEQDPQKNEYATPPRFWRRLARCVDGFDLDPCSGAESTPIADTRYTAADDGLSKAWFGDVFVNPPWSTDGTGNAKHRWLSKCRGEAGRDDVDSIVALIPSDTSAEWFHRHVMVAEVVCFYGPGRLSFQGEGRNPSIGMLIPVYGEGADAYRDVLDEMGTVVQGRGVYEPHEQVGL